MRKAKDFTTEFWESVGVYALSFLAVAFTPFLGRWIALLFRNLAYGQMNGFFREVTTSLLWAIELIVLGVLLVKRKKKRAAEVLSADTEESVAEAKNDSLLPVKNVLIMGAITIVCILIISVQIGFKVKPFYDIGEKVTGYQLLDRLGIIIRNAVKCIWIFLILASADGIAGELLCNVKGSVAKYLPYLLTGALTLAFGVYDLLWTQNPFFWTYLLFYVAFTAAYYLMRKQPVKTMLLIVFIYLF